MKKSARFYNCVRCFKQTVICRSCDRGNIYCETSCSQQARLLNHRKANKKYQCSLKGRFKHAQRQHRYRQRQKEKLKKVTDQGSPDLSPNDLLASELSEDKSKQLCTKHCHFCEESVSSFLRNGYLRYHQSEKTFNSSSWPLGP